MLLLAVVHYGAGVPSFGCRETITQVRRGVVKALETTCKAASLVNRIVIICNSRLMQETHGEDLRHPKRRA